MAVSFIETKSFLLSGEVGQAHELYPPSINSAPKVRVDLYEPDTGVPEHRTAAIFTHPTIGVGSFYMFRPLLEAGLPTLAVSTRFLGNDSTLRMERCVQDIGTAVRFLKERGYERIVLLGFSGGASLLCFYQAQAEHLTATHFPDGTPTGIRQDQLPPADKMVLFGHHLGRSQTLRNVLDASVLSETDVTQIDPDLDVFNTANGPPFSAEFIAKVREGQARRMTRITAWVRERLALLEADYGPGADEPFIVPRTTADPLMFDKDGDWKGDVGQVREYNRAAIGLGRFTTLRSWLSQWAVGASQADGPSNLAKTSLPVLSVVQKHDHRAHPEYLKQWEDALGARFSSHVYFEASHYMYPETQSEMIADLARLIADYALDRSTEPAVPAAG